MGWGKTPHVREFTIPSNGMEENSPCQVPSNGMGENSPCQVPSNGMGENSPCQVPSNGMGDSPDSPLSGEFTHEWVTNGWGGRKKGKIRVLGPGIGWV